MEIRPDMPSLHFQQATTTFC